MSAAWARSHQSRRSCGNKSHPPRRRLCLLFSSNTKIASLNLRIVFGSWKSNWVRTPRTLRGRLPRMGRPSSEHRQKMLRVGRAGVSPAMRFMHGRCCRQTAPLRSSLKAAGAAVTPSKVRMASRCAIKSLSCRFPKRTLLNTNCTGSSVPVAVQVPAPPCLRAWAGVTAAPDCKRPRLCLLARTASASARSKP